MTYRAVLGYGRYATEDAINLTAGKVFQLLPGGLSNPDPPLKSAFVAGGGRDGADLTEAHYDNRQITATMLAMNADRTLIDWELQQINRRLNDAARYAQTGEGRPVTLALQKEYGRPFTYFTVLLGSFNPYNEFRHIEWMQNIVPSAPLVLTCRPFGYGEPVLLNVTGTLANTGAAVVDVPVLQGDVPVPLQLRIKDTSSGAAFNGVMASVRHRSQGGDPTTFAFTHPLNAVSPGASQVEADSLTGTVVRATPGNNWTTVARLTQTTNLDANSGLFRLLLRVRDNVGLPPPDRSPQLTLTVGGSLANTTTYYKFTARVAGAETAASPIVAVTPFWWYGTVIANLPSVTGATDYKLYRRIGSSGTWQNRVVASTSFTDAGGNTGWTTGDSPTQPGAAGLAQFRLLYGAVNDSDSNLLVTDYQTTEIGGGSFELLDFGLNNLMPGRAPDGYTSPGWQVKAQIKLASSASGTVDLDGLITLPYHGSYGEASYPAQSLNTQRLWVLDQGLDESFRATLHDASTEALISVVTSDGRLTGEPGANRVFVMGLDANGIHKIANRSMTLRARYVPRWRHFA